MAKRRQDREALKDAERNRIQLQSFEEFKTKIMDNQKQLQKELRDERKLREELAEDYDRFREDMGDAAETIEMMTLDKEMAEEQRHGRKVMYSCRTIRCDSLIYFSFLNFAV